MIHEGLRISRMYDTAPIVHPIAQLSIHIGLQVRYYFRIHSTYALCAQ